MFTLNFTFSSNDTITIEVLPTFNGKPLVLEKERYITENSDSIYIDRFRFYISAVKLYYSNNIQFEEKNSYHLIDAEDQEKLKFTVNGVPKGKIERIDFCLGVDSLTSVSGALSGDLDPVNGMYWAWNSGYINAKLEGKSSSCKTLHNAFEFHIGGFLSPNQTIRKISVLLNQSSENQNKITLKANAATWFKNINLAKTNSVVIPGTEAINIANNYIKMFEVAN